MKQVSLLLKDEDVALILPHLLRFAKDIRILDVLMEPAPMVLEQPPQKKLKTFHDKRKARRKPPKVPESRENIRTALRECLKVDVVTPERIRALAEEFDVPARTVHNVLYVMKMRGEIEAFKRGQGPNSYRTPQPKVSAVNS